MRVLLSFLFIFSFSFGGVLNDLEKKLKNIQSITADFVQRTYMKDLQQPEEFVGKVFISKDGKVKIVYKKPIKQIYFVEDKSLTIYTPSEKQVIKSKLTDQFFLLKVFRAFVSDEGFSSLFDVIYKKEKGDLIDLVLKVKNSTDIKKVEMLLDKDYSVNQLIIWDKEGNRVEVNFYDFVYSKKPVKLYIDIPEDVEVIYY